MQALAKLALPIVISMAAATLIGVVDTVMIAPLGTAPLAAASVTASVAMIFFSALYGFVSVIGVRMASAHGKTSADALSDATRTGVIVAAVSGTIGAGGMLSVKPALPLIGQPAEVIAIIDGYWIAMSLMMAPFTVFYALKALFDAIDRPWLGVGLAFVAVIINVPANWILIHGLGNWAGFGLVGAGLASLLSQVVSLLLAWWIWRSAQMTADTRRPGTRTTAELSVQLKEGSAIAIAYVGEGGAYAVASLMMGWFSAATLAAHQIVASVGDVLYMVPLGLSIAVSIRVGQAVGAAEQRRLRRIGLAALAVIVSWMLLVMCAVLAGGGVLSAMLSADAQVVALATSMFIVVAFMQIADGVQGAMLGAVRGLMDNRIPVLITLVCYWGLALPAAYLLAFGLGLGPNGVWVGYGLGLLAAAGALTWRYFRKARMV